MNQDKSISSSINLEKKLISALIKRRMDEFDTYGSHVANQLRLVDEKTAAFVRFKIDEILFNAFIEKKDDNFEERPQKNLVNAGCQTVMENYGRSNSEKFKRRIRHLRRTYSDSAEKTR